MNDDSGPGSFRFMARFICDKMAGTLLVREPGSLRQVHVLAMRHMLLDGTVSGTLTAFGLGSAVMQEVVADLVQNEAVRIDLENDVAVVCEPFATLIQKDDVAELQTKLFRTREVKATWLLDRSTGEVFVERDFFRFDQEPGTPGVDIRPAGQEIPDLKKTANTVLARAALPLIHEALREEDVDVSRVEQIEGKRRMGEATLYIPVKGVPLVEGGEEYHVPEAPGLPGSVIEAWTRLLNKGRNVSELLVVTTPTDDLPRSPREVGEELEKNLAELAALAKLDIGTANVFDRIALLMQRIKAGFKAADEMERSQGTLDVALGERRVQLEFLESLLERAEKRVIIGSAFASPSGLSSLLVRLRPAIARGVKFALVQGLAGEDDAGHHRPASEDDGSDIMGVLKIQEERTREAVTFLRARRPFHAKFVLVDGSLGCVSSHNWLSGRAHGGPTEISASFDAPLPLRNLASMVLEWLPTDSMAETELSGSLRRGRGREVRKRFYKKEFERLEGAWNSAFEEPSAKTQQLFAAQASEAAKVAKTIHELQPSFVVVDGEHRSHMFRIAEHASKGLLIASDGISEDAAGDRFGGIVETVLERNVPVRLLWGRQQKGEKVSTDAQAAARKLLERLTPKYAKLFTLSETPSGNHAKVMVADKECFLVSSFNFLSFGAAERTDSVYSSEIGLLSFDSTLATRLWKKLV